MAGDILNLVIDGMNVEILRGESIIAAIDKLGISGGTLNCLPLAAEIDGKIYNLSYKPTATHDISLIRYGTDAGRRVYERSVKLIMMCAIKKLYNKARIYERYSLGKGLYIIIDTDGSNDKFDPLCAGDVQKLQAMCERIVAEKLPFRKTRMSLPKAIDVFTEQGQSDKAELLRYHKSDFVDVYSIGDTEEYPFVDNLFGELLPSTDYAKVFKLIPTDDGIIMLLPSKSAPDKCAEYTYPKKLAGVFAQSDDWNRLISCSTVAELNKLAQNGELEEMIRVNEALHESSYARLAQDILERGATAVMVAGPSSSGKTTSANRLSTQLRVHGLKPVMLSLDNYYIDRDKLVPDENGEYDLEHINTLDIAQFSHDLARLTQGETVSLPIFDFVTQKRSHEVTVVQPKQGNIFIIEGLHGLNPSMLTSEVDESRVYRLYISALNTLRLDEHNRIPTADVRLLRRLVRDFATRNSTADKTLSMWQSVRRGEETWIFPYQEKADCIFNTTLFYEIAVLKKYAYPLLKDVTPGKSYYALAQELLRFLDYFVDANVDVEQSIPPTSILREFIGNNAYYN